MGPDGGTTDNELEISETETIKQFWAVDFGPEFSIANFATMPSLERVGHGNGSSDLLVGMPTLNVKSLDTTKNPAFSFLNRRACPCSFEYCYAIRWPRSKGERRACGGIRKGSRS